jgi:hypothetical protein
MGCEHYTQTWSLLSINERQPLILCSVRRASGLHMGILGRQEDPSTLNLSDGTVVASHLYADAPA